jgi:predicted ester cyclase
MAIEENKKLVLRLCEEVYDQGNVDSVDELFAPHWVDHHASGPVVREDFKRHLAKNRAALSDVSFTIEDMIAEGDKVVVRGTYSAIHDRGEWLGMAPIGNRVTETVIDIYRVREGKIVEVWSEDNGPKQAEESPATQLLSERPTSVNAPSTSSD